MDIEKRSMTEDEFKEALYGIKPEPVNLSLLDKPAFNMINEAYKSVLNSDEYSKEHSIKFFYNLVMQMIIQDKLSIEAIKDKVDNFSQIQVISNKKMFKILDAYLNEKKKTDKDFEGIR